MRDQIIVQPLLCTPREPLDNLLQDRDLRRRRVESIFLTDAMSYGTVNELQQV
jgi:hypothetical protein